MWIYVLEREIENSHKKENVPQKRQTAVIIAENK